MKFEWILLLACLLFVAGCGDSTEAPKSPDPAPAELTDSSASTEPAKAEPAKETASKEPASKETASKEPADKEPAAKEPAPKKSPAQVAFDEADKKFTDARRKFIAEIRKLPRSEQAACANENAPDPADFVDEFMAIADDHPEDPAAVDSLLWVARNRIGGEHEDKAFDTLLDKHIGSEKLKDVCFALMYGGPSEKSETRLKTLIEKSPHDQVKAMSTFALANYYKNAEEGVDESKVLELFESLSSNYGDLKIHERANETFADMAKSSIFELKHLGIGKEAPEIEGEDLQGESFKLSDYRGKVVVLDFWGDW